MSFLVEVVTVSAVFSGGTVALRHWWGKVSAATGIIPCYRTCWCKR